MVGVEQVDSVGGLFSPLWVGIIQSVEGLTRTKGRGNGNSALLSCLTIVAGTSQFHLLLPLDWGLYHQFPWFSENLLLRFPLFSPMLSTLSSIYLANQLAIEVTGIGPGIEIYRYIHLYTPKHMHIERCKYRYFKLYIRLQYNSIFLLKKKFKNQNCVDLMSLHSLLTLLSSFYQN